MRCAGVLAAVATSWVACACHRAVIIGPNGTPVPAAATDSLRGTIQVVGVDAFPQVMLAPDGGGRAVTLVGPASLRRVAGLGVIVAGDRAGSQFTVGRFTVVAANGIVATDGELTADGDVLTLVTADRARHRLIDPPPGLRSGIGHRVWVSGPLDRAAVAYGIIEN